MRNTSRAVGCDILSLPMRSKRAASTRSAGPPDRQARNQGPPSTRSRYLAIVVLGCLALGEIGSRGMSAPDSNMADAHRSEPGNSYVDSMLCANCHRERALTYGLTGMGRSFYRLGKENIVEDFARNNSYYHAASDMRYTMLKRDGKYYERRYQSGYRGLETNVDEKQIDYVVGSGNHARTYLHLTSRNTLQELPVAWYSEDGGHWGMNPGYDRADQSDSRRTIAYECMFCHNAYPRIPASHEELGVDAVIVPPLPEGIDCQRCHGPGLKHIQMLKAGKAAEDVRRAIVNPARLTPEREMEVCMQCHLETTSDPLPHRIVRYDRGPFSFRPGEPLSDFALSFDRASGMGDRFEIAGGAYRLRNSACFLKSAGALRCTACHNPHDVPRGELAAAHYNGVCRQCHTASFERLVASARHTASDDCVGCHMPKRRTEDAVHVVMTDHYIQRKRPERNLLAKLDEHSETYSGEVVPYYPKLLPATQENELYNAVAQVSEFSNLKEGIPRLTRLLDQYRPRSAGFYFDLAEGLLSAGQTDQAIVFYEEAARHEPESPGIRKRLGNALERSGQRARAAEAFQRAVQKAPDDPVAWYRLGQVYFDGGDAVQAAPAFQSALTLDPDLPKAHNNLGLIRANAGDPAGAEREFREAIRVQPDLAEAHANLASVLAGRNDLPQASYYFERAIRLDPKNTAVRLNYVKMLNQTGQSAAVEKQLHAAVEADPNSADAHDLWGNVLASKGETTLALAEFQAAIRINPASPYAQLDLGELLLRTGDRQAATPYLRQAAQSADPVARQSAIGRLRQIGVGHKAAH
jgi:predicted CXXCH cytochrome family protein